MRCSRLVTAALIGLLTTTSSGETSSSEETLDRNAFEAVARDYRIHIYETFRTQREEYDRRAAEAKNVSAFWHQLEDRDQQQTLYNWFVSAKEAQELPELPDFMLDESLVIKLEVPPALVEATPSVEPQTNFRPFSNTDRNATEATVSQRKQEKPGFFSALTKALVSQPNRDDQLPEQSTQPGLQQPEAFDDFAFAETDAPETAGDAEASTEVAAEVADETPFATADQLALADDIAQFNADRDAVYAQLEDEASLTMETFGSAVGEIESLSARSVVLSEWIADFPTEHQDELPELSELDSVIFLAAERAHETEWVNDPEVDADQFDAFSRRLADLIMPANN